MKYRTMSKKCSRVVGQCWTQCSAHAINSASSSILLNEMKLRLFTMFPRSIFDNRYIREKSAWGRSRLYGETMTSGPYTTITNSAKWSCDVHVPACPLKLVSQKFSLHIISLWYIYTKIYTIPIS